MLADVRFVSLADMAALFGDVRLTPESGHGSERDGCPLSANSGHGLFDDLVGTGEQGE